VAAYADRQGLIVTFGLDVIGESHWDGTAVPWPVGSAEAAWICDIINVPVSCGPSPANLRLAGCGCKEAPRPVCARQAREDWLKVVSPWYVRNALRAFSGLLQSAMCFIWRQLRRFAEVSRQQQCKFRPLG
jgi:hypothetical protein